MMKRVGVGLSVLVTLLLLLDAAGKLLRLEPVILATQELGWPLTSVVPVGALLLIGTLLHAIPRTSIFGAIYLTAFLGGAVATHYRAGSPLATHVLFGVYVASVMWLGLALRYPDLVKTAFCTERNRP